MFYCAKDAHWQALSIFKKLRENYSERPFHCSCNAMNSIVPDWNLFALTPHEHALAVPNVKLISWSQKYT